MSVRGRPSYFGVSGGHHSGHGWTNDDGGFTTLELCVLDVLPRHRDCAECGRQVALEQGCPDCGTQGWLIRDWYGIVSLPSRGPMTDGRTL